MDLFDLFPICLHHIAFGTSFFPNPVMDLIHVWYDDRYWAKLLLGTIPTPVNDPKVNVTDLEFLC